LRADQLNALSVRERGLQRNAHRGHEPEGIVGRGVGGLGSQQSPRALLARAQTLANAGKYEEAYQSVIGAMEFSGALKPAERAWLQELRARLE
jgi:hypothetical protein